MRKVKRVLEEVSNNISLPAKELSTLKKGANDLIKRLGDKKLKAFIGGSLGKGTMVKKHGKLDADIFVVFENEKETSGLGKILKKLKLPGKLKQVHGSRDYYQIVCDKVVYELIPVVKNNDPAKAINVTDVSLSHVKYVEEAIAKKPELANEIRLAKVFCSAQGCYGAESYIGGFSGYALEVLIIHFGSFSKFLKNIWANKVYDSMNYFKNKKEVMLELNASKLQSPLIVVDPTYKYRNICAGLHLETYKKFLIASKDFLKNPNPCFFERKEFDIEGMKIFAKNNKADFLEIKLQTDRQEGDIAGTKMKKFFGFLVKELDRCGQSVLSKEFVYSGKGNTSVGYIAVRENSEIVVYGPHHDMKEAVKKFKAANHNIFIEGGVYYAKKKTSIKNILKTARKIEKEMGVKII